MITITFDLFNLIREWNHTIMNIIMTYSHLLCKNIILVYIFMLYNLNSSFQNTIK